MSTPGEAGSPPNLHVRPRQESPGYQGSTRRVGRGRLSNSCSWNTYDVQGADQTPMLSGSRWFLTSYSRGRKGDRCLRRELSESLECKSHGRTELCTLPGIRPSGGWGEHSRKGNTWLEAERECVHVCALGLRTSQGLVFPRPEAALFVPTGGGPGEGSALRTPVSTSPLTKLWSSQNRERPPQPRVRPSLRMRAWLVRPLLLKTRKPSRGTQSCRPRRQRQIPVLLPSPSHTSGTD